jgi:hypothetical protein
MTIQPFLTEPGHVDEPRQAQEFSDVLSRVATDRLSSDGMARASVDPKRFFL